ncbi:MAG: spore coat protein U-like protein [Janthinobacterium sp.]|jgi:spore coat protein U-like protein
MRQTDMAMKTIPGKMTMRKPTMRMLIRQALLATLIVTPLAALAAGSCTVASSALAFGAYQPLAMFGKLNSDAKNSSTTLSVTCSGAAGSYAIGIGPGNPGAGDGISTRYMNNSSGGDPMLFNIYTDATYMTVWGNGNTGALVTRPVPANNGTDAVTAYGRIAGGQHTLKPGNYFATMTVTITYNP